MLNESYRSFRKVYIVVGYTDLRKGIQGLSQLVGIKFNMDPYENDVLFLFCGKRSDRIKRSCLGRDRIPVTIQTP